MPAFTASAAQAGHVKRGAKGAWFDSDTGGSGHVPGFPVTEVIDTVGAGDGFAVGVISALLDGLGVDEAVKRSAWIGARAVQLLGDSRHRFFTDHGHQPPIGRAGRAGARRPPDLAGKALHTPLDELLQRADIVAAVLPLSSETRGLMGGREFGLMKPGAIFINGGRGATVQEAARLDALNHGALARPAWTYRQPNRCACIPSEAEISCAPLSCRAEPAHNDK